MNRETISAIRMAFAAGEFDRAQQLWSEYAAALHAAILDHTATEATLSQAQELIDWVGLSVKSFRAHTADQLNCIHVARVYDQPEAETPRSGVRISG